MMFENPNAEKKIKDSPRIKNQKNSKLLKIKISQNCTHKPPVDMNMIFVKIEF